MVFAREWALLIDRFNRRDSAPMMERYYAYLDEHLTTDEFAAAAEAIYSEDTYWPSPKRFVEVVHGSTNDLATAAWDVLLDAARRGNPYDPRLDAKTRAVMHALGGWNAVAYAAEDRLPFLQREFVKRYVAKPPESGAARLPAPTVLPGLPSNDDDI